MNKSSISIGTFVSQNAELRRKKFAILGDEGVLFSCGLLFSLFLNIRIFFFVKIWMDLNNSLRWQPAFCGRCCSTVVSIFHTGPDCHVNCCKYSLVANMRALARFYNICQKDMVENVTVRPCQKKHPWLPAARVGKLRKRPSVLRQPSWSAW